MHYFLSKYVSVRLGIIDSVILNNLTAMLNERMLQALVNAAPK